MSLATRIAQAKATGNAPAELMKVGGDYTPAQAWFALSNRKDRPHRVWDFPRLGADGQPICKIAIIAPTMAEMTAIDLQVEARLQKLAKEHGVDVSRLGKIKSDLEVELTLEHTVRDPEDLAKKVFAGTYTDANGRAVAAHIDTVLMPDEISVLLRQYYMTQQSVGPISSEMSVSEFNEWVRFLKAGSAKDDFLASSTLERMSSFLTQLINFLILHQETILPGTQPETSTESEESSDETPSSKVSSDVSDVSE